MLSPTFLMLHVLQTEQYKMFSYCRETALQGGLVMAKSGRLELGDNIYGHYRSIFNHCDVIGQQKQSNSVKKTQNKGHYTVQGHSRSSRSVPIESPYVTSYYWLIVTECNFTRKMAALRIWARLGDLGATYDVHLSLIRKRVVDFLIVITELFR